MAITYKIRAQFQRSIAERYGRDRYTGIFGPCYTEACVVDRILRDVMSAAQPVLSRMQVATQPRVEAQQSTGGVMTVRFAFTANRELTAAQMASNAEEIKRAVSSRVFALSMVELYRPGGETSAQLGRQESAIAANALIGAFHGASSASTSAPSPSSTSTPTTNQMISSETKKFLVPAAIGAAVLLYLASK